MYRPSVPLRRVRRGGLFWAGLACYAVVFLVCYPRITAIVDEDAYLTQALLFRSGHLSHDDATVPAPYQSVDLRPAGGRVVSKYPPGNALWLVPFTLPGWRFAFVSGLLLALAGTGLVVLILRRFDPAADPAWALLYLCYPTVVVFSRTLMSDLPAATFALAAFYLLLRGGWWLPVSGLLLGFAVAVRYSCAALVLPFAVLAAWPGRRPPCSRATPRRRLRAAFGFAVGLLPAAGFVLWYNSSAFGGPLSFPMSATGSFGLGFLPGNLLYYAGLLLAWYPLMLLAPATAPAPARRWLILPVAFLLLAHAAFSYVHTASSLTERIVIGLRYLLPALPLFVVGCGLTAERLLLRFRIPRAVAGAFIGLAVLLSVAVQWRHHRYLSVQAEYSSLVLRHVPPEAVLVCDKDVGELLGYAWGWRETRYYQGLDTTGLGARPLYAAFLDKPGRTRPGAVAAFTTMLASFPDREAVFRDDRPWTLQVFRLR